MRLNRFWREQDGLILGACAMLLAIGLTTLYSLSLTTFGNYGARQSLFAVAAVLLLSAASRVSLSDWRRATPYLMLLAMALLFATMLFGVSRNGARRWLSVGLFSLQPVEFFKVAMLLFCAWYCSRRARFHRGFALALPLFLFLSPALLLLALQPDFGSFCLLVLLAVAVLFLSGLRWRVIAAVAVGVGGLLALMIVAAPYRLQRLTVFWDTFANRYDGGYSQWHSLMAFARGGLWGEGVGRSIEKWDGHLPEAHNDFIIAIIAEEHGLVGFYIVLALWLFLIARATVIGRRAGERGEMFGALYAFGLSALLSMQVLANVAGSLALAPSKGFTLPLVSYGGSSLLATAAMVAILLRVEHENRRHVVAGGGR